MSARKSAMPERALGELFVWIDDFERRASGFGAAVPAAVWDAALRAVALRTALAEHSGSPAFRRKATRNFRDLVTLLRNWERDAPHRR